MLTLRRLLLITFGILLTVTPAVRTQGLDSTASPEYLLKAGFLYNFAQLVEWPEGVFGQPGAPIVLGILGDDPFGSIINQVVRGKKIDGRSIIVKRLKWGTDLTNCNILFVSASESGRIDEVIRAVKGKPLLTIGETPGFAKRGGIINFILEYDKIRFEVNAEGAKAANLNISSRLLSLARVPQQAPAEGKKAE